MPEPKKTQIVYETSIDVDYNFETSGYLRQLMLEVHIPKNWHKFKSLSAFKEKLRSEMESGRRIAETGVVTWFTAKTQLEFIERCEAGQVPEFKAFLEAGREETKATDGQP